MMQDMTKKYFHQLPDGLHLVHVVDVREGVQHVSEVPKIFLNRFPVNNYNMMYDMTKKIFSSTKIYLSGVHSREAGLPGPGDHSGDTQRTVQSPTDREGHRG